MRKGLSSQNDDELEHIIQQERERFNVIVDVALGQLKDSYEMSIQRICALFYKKKEDEVLAPATPPTQRIPDKDKEELSESLSEADPSSDSSSASSSVLLSDPEEEDEDDGADLESFVEDEKKPPRTYSKRDVSKWKFQLPSRPKRTSRLPLRFTPDASISAARKREREENATAITLTSKNAKSVRSDSANMDDVHSYLFRYPGDWKGLSRASGWFRTRFGNALNGIRSALGREGKQQKDAQGLFDDICKDTLLDVLSEPTFRKPAYVISAMCFFCNIKKACNTEIHMCDDRYNALLGSKCAALARALVFFFATLREGLNVDDLDNAFLAVMEAHEGKSHSKRSDNKR